MSVLGDEGLQYLTALKNLVRWKLKAAQWQLGTVRTASQIHNQNIFATVTFDHNPLKPQSQIKVIKLNPIETEKSKYSLCTKCAYDNDPEMSLSGNSQTIDTSASEDDTFTSPTNSSNKPSSSITSVSWNTTNSTINKINEEKITNYSESSHNILGTTETGNNTHKQSHIHLNNGYVSSSTESMSSPDYISLSSSVLTSPSSTEFMSSASSPSLLSTTTTEYTSLSTQSTEPTSSSTSEVHSDRHTDKITTESIYKHNESSQDVTDYDEDAITVTGSFSLLDTNASNERSKREMERIHNKVSYCFLVV